MDAVRPFARRAFVECSQQLRSSACVPFFGAAGDAETVTLACLDRRPGLSRKRVEERVASELAAWCSSPGADAAALVFPSAGSPKEQMMLEVVAVQARTDASRSGGLPATVSGDTSAG